MKTILYLAISLLALSSCGVKVPEASSYKAPVPVDDLLYKADLASVDGSNLSAQEKNVAKGRLLDFHNYRYSVEVLVKGNDEVVRKNNKTSSVYGFLGTVIGGLGALSAGIPDINTIIPVATGVWTLLGLSINSYFVQPKVKAGNDIKAQYTSLNGQFAKAGVLFSLTMRAPSQAEAEKTFNEWLTEVNAVMKANPIFGPQIPFIK